MVEAYWMLGDEAAWHFGGLLEEAAGNDKGYLAEHYARIDGSIFRFRYMLDLWEAEAKLAREGAPH